MSEWPGWLCLHLDPHGRPCNRATMKAPLSERFCSEHREAPMDTRKRGPTAEYQRERRARISQAGVSAAMEAM